MYLENSNSVMYRCLIVGNSSLTHGGGMFTQFSNPSIYQCRFLNNTAANRGGAMYAHGGSPGVSDDTMFEANQAIVAGGGLFSSFSNVSMSHCKFIDNHTMGNGGAMCMVGAQPVLHAVDDLQCVLAMAHHHDAAGGRQQAASFAGSDNATDAAAENENKGVGQVWVSVAESTRQICYARRMRVHAIGRCRGGKVVLKRE
jgi:predicted outer membrane repeat protein